MLLLLAWTGCGHDKLGHDLLHARQAFPQLTLNLAEFNSLTADLGSCSLAADEFERTVHPTIADKVAG
jgi:hypothetical protein